MISDEQRVEIRRPVLGVRTKMLDRYRNSSIVVRRAKRRVAQ